MSFSTMCNSTHPMIQAPPVTNATTGLGVLPLIGKYRSKLQNESPLVQKKWEEEIHVREEHSLQLSTDFLVVLHKLHFCAPDSRKNSNIRL